MGRPFRVLLVFSLMLVFSLVLATNAQVNLQETNHFLFAAPGDNITLPCFNKDVKEFSGLVYYWYKQSLGKKAVCVSCFPKYLCTPTLCGEFSSSRRFSLRTQHGHFDLNITRVQTSDSGIYLCMSNYPYNLNITESITVVVMRQNLTFKIQQSENEDIDRGESVSLNCSVQTGSCNGAHSVHWFKKSEESTAGVLYSRGNSSDQCEKSTDSPTNSCFYDLHIHNISSEQTGTYYCAVAACGQVLFGNGTEVRIKDGVNPILYILSGALGLSSVLVLVLTVAVFRLKHRYSVLSAEIMGDSGTQNNEEGPEQDEDSLHYAALNVQSSSRRQRVTAQTDCVYSRVHL